VEFHHVGHVTASIDKSIAAYKEIGFKLEGPVIDDEGLGVRIQFVVFGGLRIELVQPLGENSMVFKLLFARPGPYHYGFMSRSSESSIRTWAASSGYLPTISEQRARAFPGARVSFFLAKDGSIIEVIRHSDH
jgi:methylmalonyl-CoA/ethylmalonyl-CoA epimerase